jgi:hypothetical protein
VSAPILTEGPHVLTDIALMADALRQIATAIGTPANVDPLADLPGLVLMVQGLAQRAESAAVLAGQVRALEAELARLTAHTEATSPEGIGGTSGGLA